jgi:protoporphyrinogen oxidase
VRRVHTGGETLAVDEVVSTLPLGDLATMVAGGPPDPVARAAAGLRFRAIVFVYLFVRRPRISDDHWIYLPEDRFLSNRFSEAVNFSTKNAPMGKTVLCAEVTCDVGDDTWRTTDDVLAERVAADIMQLGFAEVGPGEILQVGTRRAREAYPIYDIGYRERVDRVLGYFAEQKNLLSIGRAALFRYNNMDHSIEMGLKAAEAVLGRADRAAATEIATEKTYFG